jgi:3-deoxy-manno-octulosonate cytidylyltransferase (CMP-KDO synthetase)
MNRCVVNPIQGACSHAAERPLDSLIGYPISHKWRYYHAVSMETIIVIPARYASSRFPGKPMALIAGTSLLERVWRIALAVPGVDAVFVATDDQRIATQVSAFGGRSIITSEGCRNGSERVYEALRSLSMSPRVVINLQGDAVLMPPWVIGALVEEMRRDPAVQIATPAVQLTREQYRAMSSMKSSGVVSGTTVTFAANRDALYFSKGIIPFIRSMPEGGDPPVYQHIGVYAYTCEALTRYISLPMGRFEEVEQLEQLRALEYGIPVRVVAVSLQGRTMWSVDNPQDVARAEEIIRAEGELV